MRSGNTMEPMVEIPQKKIGPVKITGPVLQGEFFVPMATFETPLWPSTERGARVTFRAGGIQTTVVRDRMTRSILLEAPDAVIACKALESILKNKADLTTIVASAGRFAHFVDIEGEPVGNLLYLRLEITTGDASGHNMVTIAAEYVLDWIIKTYPGLQYVSLSGNYCTDKKVSAINGIHGRGKHVIAETWISRKLCQRYLKTTPEKLININIKKNLIGSCLAGSIRTANAHFANMLLATYLATGQDAANIIEASQGIVHTEVQADKLYFTVNIPNLIVGSVGNGKHLEFARKNLECLGCLQPREPGENARCLAVIIAATVLCGELSLLSALTNPGELMRVHTKLERV